MRSSCYSDKAPAFHKLFIAILSLGLASVANAQRFSFGTYGDMPYGPEQLAQFPELVESLDGADIKQIGSE